MIKFCNWFVEKTFFSESHQNGAERSWIWLPVETKICVASWGYTHLHSSHRCSNHPDSLCFQAWNYGQKKPSSLCPCPVAELRTRWSPLVTENQGWKKGETYHGFGLMRALDSFDVSGRCSQRRILDSLPRLLPSAALLHQNLRLSSLLTSKNASQYFTIPTCPTPPLIETQKYGRSPWTNLHRMFIPTINWFTIPVPSILIYPDTLHILETHHCWIFLVRSGEIAQDAQLPNDISRFSLHNPTLLASDSDAKPADLHDLLPLLRLVVEDDVNFWSVWSIDLFGAWLLRHVNRLLLADCLYIYIYL